ncbi:MULTISPECIES: GNAT family N-acetyltransferase [unclassified Nocardia]|uniref:GNAT family N-acetyltransferase n=1 Tax=unclassified Nocardia TaxID=2637762 RepID=UPI001CE47043|nr:MULTISPECIES: GNAT family N-acetyltransferase [unclassified Nocardia]
MTELHGIEARSFLRPAEYDQLRELARAVDEFDGIEVRLIWSRLTADEHRPGRHYLLYYHRGRLVGFLGTFTSPGPELSGMVHPEYRGRGIFRRLWAAAMTEGARLGYESYLLIVDAASVPGSRFADALRATPDHVEHKLMYPADRAVVPVRRNGFDLRRATVDDLPILRALTADGFGMPLAEVTWFDARNIAEDKVRGVLALHEGRPIGKADYFETGDSVCIMGLTVDAAYRGRGVGRLILTGVVKDIRDRGPRDIWLEVDAVTDDALHLYQSCGFERVRSYNYYAYRQL